MVGRNKYIIQADDIPYVWKYCDNKLRTVDNWPIADYSENNKARKKLEKILYPGIKPDDKFADALNIWAESCLNSAQWVQLKNAIRNGRRRLTQGSGRKNAIVRFDMPIIAHSCLVDLAAYHDLNLEDYLLKLVNKEHGKYFSNVPTAYTTKEERIHAVESIKRKREKKEK